MIKEFLYLLTNNQGQSFDIDSNNLVILSSAPKKRKHAPDGWQEKMVKCGRNAKYFGLFRSFTIPLRFVKDSAQIIRTILYTQGLEAECNLIILKWNPKTMIHESWYKGELDLMEADDQPHWIECNVLEGGVRKTLEANEDKTQEIPLGIDADILLMDGVLLKNTVSYLIQPGYGLAFSRTMLGCLFINSEGAYRDILFNSTSSFTNGGDYSPGSSDFLVRNDGPPITFVINASYKVKREFSLNHSVLYQITDGVTPQPTVMIYSGSAAGDTYLQVNFNTSITLGTNQRLFILSGGGSAAPNAPLYYDEGGTLEIAFDYRYPETPIRHYRADVLAGKIINQFSGGTISVNAPVLAATGSGTEADPARALLITSGDGIRGFGNAVIKTNFNDFFQAMNVVKFIGLDIENEKIIIENREKFFSGPVAFDFGEVKVRPRITPAKDIIFNKLRIGYPDQNYEDVNGRSEVNTTQEYSLPITRVAKTMDLISPYRADPYGYEYQRINMEGQNTTDNKGDNNVFIIDAIGIKNEEGIMIWRPYRYPYTSITGILTDSIFNVELSPKRLLNLHMPEIAPFFYKMSGKDITFKASEKNADMVTTIVAGPVTEIISERAGVVPIYDSALYHPFYFEIVTKVPANLIQIINAARAGEFSFTWKGDTYKGCLIDGGIKPVTMEEQTIKLIVSKENDLTKLIR